jgi:hypothetical protein
MNETQRFLPEKPDPIPGDLLSDLPGSMHLCSLGCGPEKDNAKR